MSCTGLSKILLFLLGGAVCLAPHKYGYVGFDLVSAAHAQDQGRVFELRTYTVLEGKLEDLKRRFQDHVIKICERHGIVLIGMWTPQDGPKNTLVYIVAHQNRAAAKRSWDSFVKDPDWIKARDESERNGKFGEEIVSVFMDPTPFSPVK